MRRPSVSTLCLPLWRASVEARGVRVGVVVQQQRRRVDGLRLARCKDGRDACAGENTQRNDPASRVNMPRRPQASLARFFPRPTPRSMRCACAPERPLHRSTSAPPLMRRAQNSARPREALITRGVSLRHARWGGGEAERMDAKRRAHKERERRVLYGALSNAHALVSSRLVSCGPAHPSARAQFGSTPLSRSSSRMPESALYSHAQWSVDALIGSPRGGERGRDGNGVGSWKGRRNRR